LKRRLKNIFIVSVLGIGGFYGYRAYQNHVWYADMSDSDKTIGTKPRLVVLGTGAYSFEERIETKFDLL